MPKRYHEKPQERTLRLSFDGFAGTTWGKQCKSPKQLLNAYRNSQRNRKFHGKRNTVGLLKIHSSYVQFLAEKRYASS